MFAVKPASEPDRGAAARYLGGVTIPNFVVLGDLMFTRRRAARQQRVPPAG
jgi:hypothetical protein